MPHESPTPIRDTARGSTALEAFLPFMRDVGRCEQSLQELGTMWRIIESSARMNCPVEARTILPTIAATRAGFARLEQEMVAGLVQEKMRDVMAGIGTKARYLIDIVVRNLFERTADVGFLATDRALCDFVAGAAAGSGPESGQDAQPDAIRARLQEYRDKYTVYDEIMLLDTRGRVLVQLDGDASPVHRSTDPLIAESIARDGHVETFRATDLRPGAGRALLYSRRMHHPATGAVVGVLCMSFNLAQEMQGIFAGYRDGDERCNLLLLDGDDRVVASADPLWIAPGTRVPVDRDGSMEPRVFGGREYLVRTFSSPGYQGYPGPAGWQGQAMVPVDLAFRGAAGADCDALSALPPAVAEGLLSHAGSFCPPLHDIMAAARTVQRIVWNGQVMTVGQEGDLTRLSTVLEQISETGERSNALFARSIRDLYRTALASSLRNARLAARLLVDLLDRNLYERSDDCRWWALTPELRAGLSRAGGADDAARGFGEILARINGLYTVYTRLFVYDREGVVVAASGQGAVLGSRIDAQTLARVAALRGTHDYHASAFEPSPFYDDGRDTYIYHAAIRHIDEPARVVGGIGIVFDATPQLLDMLRAGLDGRADSHAMYVDRGGRILSSTDPARPAGGRLDIDDDLLRLANGAGASRIVVRDGQYALVACTVSSGYREFKTGDGYRDDVIAVVVRHFGAVRPDQGLAADRSSLRILPERAGAGGSEFATFFCGGSLYALPALHVQEAVAFSEVQPTPLGGGGRVGILGLQGSGPRQGFVWVYDLARLTGTGRTAAVTADSQVVVVGFEGHVLGLLVDELHAVPRFESAQIVPTPLRAESGSMLVAEVIKANQGAFLIQAIDVRRLFAWLIDGIEPQRQDRDAAAARAALKAA